MWLNAKQQRVVLNGNVSAWLYVISGVCIYAGYVDDIPLHQARIRRQRYLTVGYMSHWGIQSIPKAY